MNKYELIKKLVNMDNDDVTFEDLGRMFFTPQSESKLEGKSSLGLSEPKTQLDISKCYQREVPNLSEMEPESEIGYKAIKPNISSSFSGGNKPTDDKSVSGVVGRTVLLSPMFKDVCVTRFSVRNKDPYEDDCKDKFYKEVCKGRMTYVEYLNQRPGVYKRMRKKQLDNLICRKSNPFDSRNLNLRILLSDKTHVEYIDNFIEFCKQVDGAITATTELNRYNMACAYYMQRLYNMEVTINERAIILLMACSEPISYNDKRLVGRSYVDLDAVINTTPSYDLAVKLCESYPSVGSEIEQYIEYFRDCTFTNLFDETGIRIPKGYRRMHKNLSVFKYEDEY